MIKYCFGICILAYFSMTAQTYQAAESVAFDIENSVWLVANGNSIIKDDGQGNLSFFGTGTASHGMEIMGTTLFAISSNTIKGYDIDTEMEVMSLSIPGVSFLNGMASDGVDQLWVTDFGDNTIYHIDVSAISNPVATQIVSNTGATPNGILFDDTRLLFVTWGNNASIKAVDLTTHVVTDVVANTGVGNIDGIIKTNFTEYIITSWSPGRVIAYDSDFSSSYVISDAVSNPADLGFNDFDRIGVPVGNDLVFMEVNWEASVDEFNLDTINFIISENPISPEAFISFNLLNNAEIGIELFDLQGKFVKTVFIKKQSLGFNKVPLDSKNLPSGTYILKITVNGASASKKLLVD